MVTIDGQSEAPLTVIMFDLDAEFGALRIDTDCGRLLGSFSLLADGRAGFTVAGSSDNDCSAEASNDRNHLLTTLAAVATWSENEGRLDLQTATGDSLALTR